MLTGYTERLLQLYALLEQTQQRAFEILQDEQIPLNNPLSATAKFALKSSARNQFFGTVATLDFSETQCNADIQLANSSQKLTACITNRSAKRLELSVGKEVMLMIKAPWLKLHREKPQGENVFQAKIQAVNEKEVVLNWNGLECFATSEQAWQVDEMVWGQIEPEQIILLTL